jgi:hypothetical protein
LVEKPEEKIGKYRYIYKDNIKIDFKDIKFEDVNWIHQAEEN